MEKAKNIKLTDILRNGEGKDTREEPDENDREEANILIGYTLSKNSLL